MPPLVGRGRPRVAHEGECARRDRNRASLDGRFRRYRAASAHFIDRSDDVPWIASVGREEALDLEDAFEPVLGPFGPIHGPGALQAMQEWERMETARRTVARMLWEGRRARLDRTLSSVEAGSPCAVGSRLLARLDRVTDTQAKESL